MITMKGVSLKKYFCDFREMKMIEKSTMRQMKLRRLETGANLSKKVLFLEDIKLFATDTHICLIYPNSSYTYQQEKSSVKFVRIKDMSFVGFSDFEAEKIVTDGCFDNDNNQILLYDAINNKISVFRNPVRPKTDFIDLENLQIEDLVIDVLKFLDTFCTKNSHLTGKQNLDLPRKMDFCYSNPFNTLKILSLSMLLIETLNEKNAKKEEILNLLLKSVSLNLTVLSNSDQSTKENIEDFVQKLSEVLMTLLESKISATTRKNIIEIFLENKILLEKSLKRFLQCTEKMAIKNDFCGFENALRPIFEILTDQKLAKIAFNIVEKMEKKLQIKLFYEIFEDILGKAKFEISEEIIFLFFKRFNNSISNNENSENSDLLCTVSFENIFKFIELNRDRISSRLSKEITRNFILLMENNKRRYPKDDFYDRFSEDFKTLYTFERQFKLSKGENEICVCGGTESLLVKIQFNGIEKRDIFLQTDFFERKFAFSNRSLNHFLVKSDYVNISFPGKFGNKEKT
ncbi:hypothetical protein MHBO_002609, partial [Bonamia ostreae]